MPNSAASPNVDFFVNGTELPDTDFLSYVVDRDMYQPDMAAIVLSNQGDVYSTQKIGDEVEIKVGEGGRASTRARSSGSSRRTRAARRRGS